MREHTGKFMLAFLIGVMVFAFAGCSSDSEDTKATDDTAGQTTEATEATEATTAADDYDIMFGSRLEETDDAILLYGNDFLLTMPDDDDWAYEQTDSSTLEIYYKDARDAGFGGSLVTIMAFDPEDTSYEDFPDYSIA